MQERNRPYQKLPLMRFSGGNVEVEKRPLTVYEQLGGGESP